mgnify:CR=1 FL=1
MNRSTQIWIGVVALAGLGGLAYMQYNKDKAVGTTQEKPIDVPEIKGTDDVDKLSIMNGDKGEVLLEKKGDKWMVTKPIEAAATSGSSSSFAVIGSSPGRVA